MNSKKRIRAEDYEGGIDDQQKMKLMVHELESEVIQKQSMLHDMRIPKTPLEIALVKLSQFQKAEIKKLRLRLTESEKQVDERNEVKKLQTRVGELQKQLDYKTELQYGREKLKVVDIQKLQTRIGGLERQLDYKTELQNELEIIIEAEVEKLQRKIASLEKQADETKRLKKTVVDLTKSLSEKTECNESLEDLNKILTVNEHRHNDELQKARKILIQGIGESAHSRSSIRVKRMGELDSKPFGSALKRKRSSSSADLVANQTVLLCNFWEQMLRDQAWHPFKITLVDGKHQELIDDEDKLLKSLKNEWGKRAYFAVVNALVEMNEYNPSCRNPVQELWNFKEKRRATVMEGVAALVHRLRKKHTPTATAITFNK